MKFENYNINEVLKKLGSNLVVDKDDYINAKAMTKFYCTKCNNYFYANPTDVITKYKGQCKICIHHDEHNYLNGHKKTLNITHPNIAKLLLNPEDGDKYTSGSNAKVDWVCPDCGNIIRNKIIANVIKQNLSCSVCSDGLSYPAKLMYNLFLDLNIFLDTEYSPNWIKPKRFDGFFIVNNQEYIIEMDGNLGHGKKIYNHNSQTIEESKAIDDYKDKLAEEHNIKVIRIDCDKSDLELIKTNILNSKLSKLFDLTNVNWDNIHKKSLKSKVIEAGNLYNNGVLNPVDIALKIGVGRTSATSYLKKCTEIGLCKYDNKLLRKLNSHVNSGSFVPREVICITTNIKFNSLSQASKYYHMQNGSNIGLCCDGQRQYAGTHLENYLPLVWMYYDDYIKATDDEIEKRKKIKSGKGVNIPIICLETNEIFPSFQKASVKFQIKTKQLIKDICEHKREYVLSGNNKFSFMYYQDYLNQQESQKQDSLLLCSND